MTRPLLPLFPLPNVVLFPGVPLPLHIFESRYRAMVADALEGDRRIVMVLLKPGFEADYEGRPPIFPIGCSGVIVHAAKLDDGRYNIVLNGLDRVRVIEEDHERPYRLALVEAQPDAPSDADETTAVRAIRARLETFAGVKDLPKDAAQRVMEMTNTDFVHTMAMALDLEPVEKQAVLEQATLGLRAQALVDLLEMHRLAENAQARSTRPN
jgi:Lon protease-like protein